MFNQKKAKPENIRYLKDIISKKIAFLFCNKNKYSIFNFSKEKFSTLL